jgi:hypothetical protein
MTGQLHKVFPMPLSSTSPNNLDLSEVSGGQPMFFVVSIKKLVVMGIFTFGLYWTYCFYRSWVLYRGASGERVNPLVRAVFEIFFRYSLLSRVDRQMRLSGRSYAWSPFWLACAPIILWAISVWVDLTSDPTLLSTFGLLVIYGGAQFWAVTQIQQAINFCMGDVDGKSNTHFSLLNWVWMSIGILILVWIIWVLVVLFVVVFRGP